MNHVKKLKKAMFQFVRIKWIDSASHSNGWSATVEPEAPECETCGYITGVNDNAVSVSATKGGDEYNQHFTIPLGCIISVKIVDK